MGKRVLNFLLVGGDLWLLGVLAIALWPRFFLWQAIFFYGRHFSIEKVHFTVPQWKGFQLHLSTLEVYTPRYYMRCDSLVLSRKKVTVRKLTLAFLPAIVPKTVKASYLLPQKIPLLPSLPETFVDTAEIHRGAYKIFLHRLHWKERTFSTYWQWEQNHGILRAHWTSQLHLQVLPLSPLRYEKFYLTTDTLYFQIGLPTLSARLGKITFFHPQVSQDTLFWEVPAFTFRWHESPDSFYLHAQIKDPIPLYATLTLRKTPLCARLRLDIPKTTPQNFLAFFPENFFTHLTKFRYSGQMEITFLAGFDVRNPDSLYLDAFWKTYNLQITHYGGLCIPCYNEPFYYMPYGERFRFFVGESNPDFILLRQIPPYVLLGVLHAEDGGFFYHRGFHPINLGKAILENRRCKCMRRGASTLTMQVVRNLFLTRRKTLSRKVEEIFLTALIERLRLLSKERILEIYFNIAEWGPGIYGIVAASQFYFHKNPHQLTIPESIFLGMLLPAPKKYRYHFVDSTLCLKDMYKGYLQHIGSFLVRQKYLSPDSLETLSPNKVCLQGLAKDLFLRNSFP